MKEQIALGVDYISKLINRHNKLDQEKMEKFEEKLTAILCEKYADHWYPENPIKGQAYRCIRINRKQHVDESLQKACSASGLAYSDLPLPTELCLWIDPSEVSCRLGENSSHFTVTASEDKEVAGKKSPSELETSDYHSEGSDSPCESSSEDESARKPTKQVCTPKTPVISTVKQGTQYFYHPAPAAPFFIPYGSRNLGFIPTYQPMTLYYIYPKVQKVFPQPSRTTRQKRKVAKP
ncbi:protein BTG3-like [Ambystoma mexicanum]|uniref:protein BTG3-like n=1 Tax=Ambystoma mexicanum TaxID=8296 RepID=UPI0037E9450B